MEILAAPRHSESVLTALSQVPIATTKQLSSLNQSLDPQKKASKVLRDLEQEKLIGWKYHGHEKIWFLTKKGRKLQRVTPTRFPTDLDHDLAVINLYFTLKPKRWIYEPVEKFTHLGREFVWNPDCVFVYNKKAYACELQKTRITSKRWEKKWKAYNLYFNRDYFRNAKIQEWRWSPDYIFPDFLVITSQNPIVVRNGFEVRERDLIVVGEFK